MTASKGASPESAATDRGTQKNAGSGRFRSSKPQPHNAQAAPKSLRGVLPIHPGAELFPRMSANKPRALGEDIRKNGAPRSFCTHLFEVEKFNAAIWGPACGIGCVAEAARRAGYRPIATDMVERGCARLGARADILYCVSFRAQNIVCNPPLDSCDQFVQRALRLAGGKVAMIWLAGRLKNPRLLTIAPPARVSPRSSAPPGQVIVAGQKPSGGSQDFGWLVFDRSHVGPADRGPRRSAS
jgi:hypothetical protein